MRDARYSTRYEKNGETSVMFQVFKRIMKRRVYSAFWYSLRFTALSSTALLLRFTACTALPRLRIVQSSHRRPVPGTILLYYLFLWGSSPRYKCPHTLQPKQ